MNAITMIQKQRSVRCSFLQKLILLIIFFKTAASVQGDIVNDDMKSLHKRNERPTISDNEGVNIFGKA